MQPDVLGLVAFIFLSSAIATSPTHSNPAPRPLTNLNTVFKKHIPHLALSNLTTYLLPYGEVWRPSYSTLITALKADRPMRMSVRLKQDELTRATEAEPVCHLLYKCSSDEAEFQEIELASNANDSSSSASSPGGVYCEGNVSFKLTRAAKGWQAYDLTLQPDSRMYTFEHLLRHTLEFRVRVRFTVGTVESASLFAYSIDSLKNYDATPLNVSGVMFTKYIAAKEAEPFLTRFALPANARNISSMQLLDRKFVKAFKSAPLLIKPQLHVTLMIVGGEPCTSRPKPDGRILVTTGEADPDVRQFITLQPGYVLNMNSGIMTFSLRSLLGDLTRLRTRHGLSGNSVSVCLRVTLNPPVWNYRLTLTLAVLSNFSLPSHPLGLQKGYCTLAKTRLHSNFVSRSFAYWQYLTEGMRDAVLVSHVVCDSITDLTATVEFNGYECTNFIAGGPRFWQDCDGFAISRNGNAVLIRGPVSQRHRGEYRFKVNNLSFSHFVTVVSLPLFKLPDADGSLPGVTYANLDSQVKFKCTVYHDGMKHVTMMPIFRVMKHFERSPWQDLSCESFATDVLGVRPSDVTVAYGGSRVGQARRFSSELLVTVPPVTMKWKSWMVSFRCPASIDPSDVEKMGFPHYSVESQTDVQFFGVRIQASGGRMLRHIEPIVVAVSALIGLVIFAFF